MIVPLFTLLEFIFLDRFSNHEAQKAWTSAGSSLLNLMSVSLNKLIDIVAKTLGPV
jgi:hypothetical protein